MGQVCAGVAGVCLGQVCWGAGVCWGQLCAEAQVCVRG